MWYNVQYFTILSCTALPKRVFLMPLHWGTNGMGKFQCIVLIRMWNTRMRRNISKLTHCIRHNPTSSINYTIKWCSKILNISFKLMMNRSDYIIHKFCKPQVTSPKLCIQHHTFLVFNALWRHEQYWGTLLSHLGCCGSVWWLPSLPCVTFPLMRECCGTLRETANGVALVGKPVHCMPSRLHCMAPWGWGTFMRGGTVWKCGSSLHGMTSKLWG